MMRNGPPFRIVLTLGSIALAVVFTAFGAEKATVELRNESLSIVGVWSGVEGLRVDLTSRLTDGRTIRTVDAFLIRVNDGVDLTAGDFERISDTATADRGKTIATLSLSCRKAPLNVDVIYELAPKAAYLRKSLLLRPTGATGSGGANPLINHIDVCRWTESETPIVQGMGQPVCFRDYFLGIEFPAADNRQEGDIVQLRHYPGRKLDGPMRSKTAVIGVAEPGRSIERFQAYLRDVRIIPSELNLFVNYNTWWTLMPPTEENCIELIRLFKTRLYDRYGETLDTFTIDDGWDNKDSIWEIRSDRFPNGFAPLLPELAKMKAKLGLWLSPSSGYGHAPWGGKNGYEQTNETFLCLAGPKYRGAIVPRVFDLARTYGLTFYKFDGFCSVCDVADHGHPLGACSREAIVDAYIELLRKAREANPNIFLDPTCGIWLSPWWLLYADALWGSVSGDYPDPIVPAPILRDSNTTTRDAVFRQRCEQHPCFPADAMETLGIIVITPEKWEDNAMAVLGRGSRLLTLYINPRYFERERDWEFLARAIGWVRRNAFVLSHTKMIGGDPFKREAYGFAHFEGDRGIISLRNPFADPAEMAVLLDEGIGLSRGKAESRTLVARALYPYRGIIAADVRFGANMKVPLGGYEQLTLEVLPRDALAEPGFAGCRYEIASRSAGEVSYRLCGNARPRLVAPATCGDVSCNGQAMRDGDVLPVALDEDRVAPSAANGQLSLAVESKGHWPKDAPMARVVGTADIRLPPGTAKAELLILCDPVKSEPAPLSCRAAVGGKPAEIVHLKGCGGNIPRHYRHAWEWFTIPVDAPGGEVRFELALAEGNHFFCGAIASWLRVEEKLAERAVTLKFKAAANPPTESAPLPIHQNVLVTTLRVHEGREFRLGTRWPDKSVAVVYLDQTEADKCTQDWGSLQRNRSVWEKPMLINGRPCKRGIGAHANGVVTYELAGSGFKTFHCEVGRDSHAGDGKVVFQVLVDGKKVFDSGPMTKNVPAKGVDVSVEGASRLDLITNDGGDGISGDHGDWADAQLRR